MARGDKGLLQATNEWIRNMHVDQSHLNGVLFLGLRKALDIKNVSILLHKLELCGVRSTAFTWFKSHLTGRKQKT